MTEMNEGMSSNTCSRIAARSAGYSTNGSPTTASPTRLRQASARPAGRGLQGAGRRGWIFYDGDCAFCVGLADRVAKTFRRRGFGLLPLQTPWVQERPSLDQNSRPDEMRVLTSDGRDFGGASAIVFLARQVWWMWPLFALGQFPGMSRVFDRGYRWVAAYRGCNDRSGSCTVNYTLVGGHRPPLQKQSLLVAAGPLVVVWCLRGLIAPWVFMWLMAGAIFLGAKWLTLSRAPKHETSFVRALAYLLLWPGMDARNFFTAQSAQRSERSVFFALAKTALGAALLFGVARMLSPDLLQGWIGMIGLVLILHFGVFDLLAIAWRNAGVIVRPIMNAPIKSTSLAEFWGRRWNGAFNVLVRDLFFRRLARRFGTPFATLGSFLFSGLLHELVISLPAAGGYGLPAGYFLVQGAGVIAQRKWKLRRGFLGWMVTMAIVVLPAFWLFHPVFVRRVIIPFLQAIGAL